MLTIFNSLTRQKEIFQSLEPKKIRMYVCGMTVYDYCHIGHARVLLVFDVLTRYLRAKEYEVHYVRNITDVDDKIIKRANEENISISELTNFYISALNEDIKRLGIEEVTEEPRATEFIPQMIAMIETLLSQGYAYIADNGDVYYKVNRFKKYGQLAHKDIEGLRAGARIEINENKEDALDFVLWKIAKTDEPSWPSPWGLGRPGWHIECSAMSTYCLGHHFDIHGGGADLQFPHHENEIAQAEAATGEKFVNTWMHVGFVQVNKEKMSKSLKNFITIRELLEQYTGETIRYFMLASHYRSPINYAPDSLQNAELALSRLYKCLRDVPLLKINYDASYIKRFYDSMDDDLNTPEAIAVLFDLAREINKQQKGSEQVVILANTLRYLGGLLGLLQEKPEVFLKGSFSKPEVLKIEELLEARNKARKDKDWTLADDIRKQLDAMGIIIEDSPLGTVWHRKS